ncbi:MAG: SWIM zinc finger family protein [Cyanobacteria bacterium J06623_7]
MVIPRLSQAVIRESASSKSWHRGKAYYDDGYVRQVTQRGQSLLAEVSGSRRYRVAIDFSDRGLESAHCNCPYDWGGYCKHIVASLLFCLREPENIQVRSSLEEILDRLNEVQTQSLIQQLTEKQPELLDDIERIANRFAPAIVTKASADRSESNITINVGAIKSQVRNILQDSVRHFEWGGEEDIASEEICSLIQDAQMYTQQGDYDNAIAMLTAITESCVENWDVVDDYGVDNCKVATDLSEIWCETILSADLAEADKTDLAVNLEFWRNAWGEYFQPAITALEQGWDYPPLQQVLAGHITSSGAWSGEVPDYADDLASIRLQILERQSRFTEYLYLAEAEGQVERHLNMLVRLNRVEEAMQVAKRSLSTLEQALAFSQCLVNEQNAQIEALAIAKQGLRLSGIRKYDLANWTHEIALELDDLATARAAKITAFEANPNFTDYQRVAELAADNWLDIKPELLTALAKNDSWHSAKAKIDIYLHESMIDQAIAVIDDLGIYHGRSVHRVMDAAIATHPDWVIRNALERAEAIMDAGKAKYYEEAVEWLQKVRAAYIASDRKQAWSAYRANLVDVHGRKRKLMGLMEPIH